MHTIKDKPKQGGSMDMECLSTMMDPSSLQVGKTTYFKAEPLPSLIANSMLFSSSIKENLTVTVHLNLLKKR
jgi:hypothetical protein